LRSKRRRFKGCRLRLKFKHASVLKVLLGIRSLEFSFLVTLYLAEPCFRSFSRNNLQYFGLNWCFGKTVFMSANSVMLPLCKCLAFRNQRHWLKGLVLLQVYIVSFALGMGAIPWLIMSEVILPICQFKLDLFVEISGCEMLLNSLSTRNASYLMRLAANSLPPSL